MNKWIYLVASCFTLLGTFYAFPFVKINPSSTNLIIFSVFVIFTVLGLYLFFKKPNTKIQKEIVNGQELTPIN